MHQKQWLCNLLVTLETQGTLNIHINLSFLLYNLDNIIQEIKTIKSHACNACSAIKVQYATLTTSKG